ncbi:DUF6042 family protein [Tepidibacter formicigenes]|uniref:Uncharacterized protein n=1 Tax=Tepidibacter formicigenes DSM 15518 TaxID=1123349 RepID=A0A1M6TDU8_9FIRM|nr:DUF6042 family protein [Tepidibacter formicigenes]SHK55212.1 hypothetical protein SAMN02744037_02581 [Tepidibacter formicigenes DSM 15518]
MSKKKVINIQQLIQQHFWFRYLPETTYKTYLMIGHLHNQKIRGEEASKKLLTSNFNIEHEIGPLREEKENVLKKLGQKYPTNRLEDIQLLLTYKLIKVAKDENENLVYLYNIPVPKPEEVLNLDEEERTTLENIRFEFKHQNAFNALLTLILNSNGNLLTTLDHIHTTTKIKHADIREILDYLVKEGSIKVKADKNVKELRKSDKVYIAINKEVFEQKRFVIG